MSTVYRLSTTCLPTPTDDIHKINDGTIPVAEGASTRWLELAIGAAVAVGVVVLDFPLCAVGGQAYRRMVAVALEPI